MNGKTLIISSISLITLITCLVLLAYESSLGLGFGGTRESWAQFGDFFGGVLNPFLGVLSILGVVYGLKLQADALREAEITRMASIKLQDEHLVVQTNFFELEEGRRAESEILKLCTNLDEHFYNAMKDLDQRKIFHGFNAFNWSALSLIGILPFYLERIDRSSNGLLITYIERAAGACVNLMKTMKGIGLVEFHNELKEVNLAIEHLNQYVNAFEKIIADLEARSKVN